MPGDKSTVEQIRERFDRDVERFSDLETGQVSTVDAVLSLELITESAKRIRPDARDILDVGCGAGNHTLKMLAKLPGLNCTLVDLSLPMLQRALGRVSAATGGNVETVQGDIREVPLERNGYDIIFAGAVLHHLRGDDDWVNVFTKLYGLLRTGGCLIVSDLMVQESDALTGYFRERYFEYLASAGGEEYARGVFEYIEKEDSPRSATFHLELMKRVGFSIADILHKNICFAAVCAVK